MELTFEFEFEFRNSEFGIWKPGCICRGACGPVALPLMVHCDIVTKKADAVMAALLFLLLLLLLWLVF
jgi:hypothetical protein